MKNKKETLQTRVRDFPLPAENQRVRYPYLVFHNKTTRGDIYQLMTGPAPSHINLAWDTGHELSDPSLVGGGLMTLEPAADGMTLAMESGSGKGGIPEAIQELFAAEIKTKLEGQRVHVKHIQSTATGDLNPYWEQRT